VLSQLGIDGPGEFGFAFPTCDGQLFQIDKSSSALVTRIKHFHQILTSTGIACLGLLVCLAAISNESYWIDEAGTAVKAVQPTIRDWWHSMTAEGNSNLQLPLYLLFVWGWEKLSGLNEFALRAGNAPWFLLGLLAMWRALAINPPLRKGMILVALCSPFAWYYLDEARPYAMQIGLSFVVFAALFRLGAERDELAKESQWVVVLCLGSLLLAASGMLAMLWLGAFLGAAVFSTSGSQLRRLVRSHRPWLGLTAVALFAVGFYYLWTMSLGARATDVGGTNVKNLAFIFYELLGFTGLGPGRLSIRADGLTAFHPWLPELLLYGLTILVVLAAGWRQITAWLSLRARWCWSLAFVLVLAFIMVVGIAVRFRVLGRHCTPILPLGVFVLGAGVAELLKQKNRRGQLVVAAFVGLSLASCLSQRFCERHAKDDYRGAVAIAQQALAHDERVWWNADKNGAVVYHLPLSTNPGDTKVAFELANPTLEFIASLAPPDVIIASRPDVYDANGALAEMVAQTNYKQVAVLPAFIIWEKTSGPND
jgi:hypothetical protein